MKLQLMIVLIVCLLSILAVLLHSLAGRERLHSVFLTTLYISVGIYLFGYILELGCTSLEAALTAISVQNIGVCLIGPFFLIFMLVASQSRMYRRWMVYAAGVYALSMYVLILTTSAHQLYYVDAWYRPFRDMYYVSFQYGPLYTVHQAVLIACCVLACVVPGVHLYRWNSQTRKCMGLLIMGALITLSSDLVFLLRIIPRQIDTTPIFMTATLLCCHGCLVRYKMYNLTGIASESAIQSMDDAVVILDSRWCFQFANISAQRLFPELKRLSASDSLLYVTSWPQELSECTGAGHINFEMETSGGEKRHYHAHVSAVGSTLSSMGWSLVIRDTTESFALLEQMQALAATDSLTGIYNRRYFMDNVQRYMDQEAREQRTSSMVFFDIDHFKMVNDTYGHQTGDIVLRMVADVVRKELRSYDLFARYGGEEFAIYAINVSLDDAEKLAQRLCKAVRELCIRHQGEEIRVTASFGVAEVRWNTALEDALSTADAAMYRAKENGRNRVERGCAIANQDTEPRTEEPPRLKGSPQYMPAERG